MSDGGEHGATDDGRSRVRAHPDVHRPFSKTVTVKKTAVAGTALLSAAGGRSGFTIRVPVTVP